MKKILVVDDEKALRDILKKIFTQEGYIVQTAGDGKEAISKLKNDKLRTSGGREIDLLITDLRMPGIDGVKMLLEIEKVRPEIKVAIITGYPLDPSIRKKIDDGVYAYFAKPFDNEKLVEYVKGLKLR